MKAFARASSMILLVLSPGYASGGDEDDYGALMKKARAALMGADLDAARTLCKRAFEKSGDPPEGGARSAEAMGLCGDVEAKRDRKRAAIRFYRHGAHLALDDSALRRRLLIKRRTVARAGVLERELERTRDLLGHDVRVESALKQPATPMRRRAQFRASLGEARTAYEGDRDPNHADLAAAASALVAVRSGAAEEGVNEARVLAAPAARPDAPASLTPPPRARRVRLVALEALWIGAIALEDDETAVRAALELNALRYENLPEPRRRYARMKGLDALCARYDERNKPGSCARLEREVTGRYSFTDRSLEKVRKELSEDDVERVHRQFLPAIEECVLESARAHRESYQDSTIQITWAIQQRGLAYDLEIAPKRYREDLTPCVSERVSWLRYPRYSAPERKTVTIPYNLD